MSEKLTDLDDFTIPEAIGYMDTLPYDEAATLARADERKGILDYIAERGKNGQNTSKSASAAAVPTRFVCFHGCPKSFRLEPTTSRITSDGHRFSKPGLVIVTKKSAEAPGLRMIEVPQLDACRRAENRLSPEQVSESIMQTIYFTGFEGGQPVIVPYDEWKAEHQYKLSRAAERKAEDDEFIANLKAKRGKRGASA